MRRLLVLASLALPLVAGCTGDDAPDQADASRSVAVYLVHDGKVAPVRRTIRSSSDQLVATTLATLADGTIGAEAAEGYTTEAPGSAPDDVSVEDGTATVELPSDTTLSRMATAQLVHTVTQFPEIRRVVVNGGSPLTRKSFEDLAPQIIIESPLSGDVVQSPVRLRGTANVYEATVSIQVRDTAGRVVLDTFTTATSGTGTRGTFAKALALPDENGPLTVTAYEASAEDGRPLHTVDVQVTVSG